jgi:hypothetical protein
MSVSSIWDKYRYAYQEAAKFGLSRQWKIVVLKDPDDRSPDFLETVMVNNGYMFRVFADEKTAIVWLRQA